MSRLYNFLRTPTDDKHDTFMDGVEINQRIQSDAVTVDFDLSKTGIITDINTQPITTWRCTARLYPDNYEITWYAEEVILNGFYYEVHYETQIHTDFFIVAYADSNERVWTTSNRQIESVVVTVFDNESTNPEDWHFVITGINTS